MNVENYVDYGDNFYVNEDEKIAVRAFVYGDEAQEYFLSQMAYYDSCPYEAFEGDTDTLVNQEIDEENTFEKLLQKTQDML